MPCYWQGGGLGGQGLAYQIDYVVSCAVFASALNSCFERRVCLLLPARLLLNNARRPFRMSRLPDAAIVAAMVDCDP